MYLIDTHSHIFLEEFEADREQVIRNALDKNIRKIFLPNIDRSSIQSVLNLHKKYPENCFPLMGLHPGSVAKDFETELEQIKKTIEENKIYGIGETGLDFYWDTTYKDQQIRSFTKQIHWAIEMDLPLIIHVRDSFDEVVDCIKRNYDPKLKGIFHCFTGGINEAEIVFDLGFLIGIGGIVTFKNSGLAQTIEKLPLEKMVLETDSPYLAPTPFRGKRNESAYIDLIAEKIAEIKKIPKKEVAEVTSQNALKLFGLI